MRANLLGDFQLWNDNGLVPSSAFPTRKVIELLLALIDQPQQRLTIDQLSDRLWPARDPDAARKNLHVAIGHLRRALEPDLKRPADSTYLITEGDTYQLRIDGWTIDVQLFDQHLRIAQLAQADQKWIEAVAEFRAALALYRGDYLIDVRDAEWTLTSREKYREARLDALEQLAECYARLKQPRAELEAAQQVVAVDPLRESAWRLIMSAHTTLGEAGLALRAYHTCATNLQSELNIAPSLETLQLYQHLLNDSSLPTVYIQLSTSNLQSQLVGREQEWSGLQNAWHLAATTQPIVVLLQGEVGIGKTRLAEEFSQWAARQNIAVSKAQCYANESALAYAPVTAALRSRPLPKLTALWRTEIARLLPEVLSDRPDLPPPGPLSETWQQQRFFEALAHAILDRSTDGTLILIDDVQWCDRDSLDWLIYFVRFAAQTNPRSCLLLLLTLRPDEIDDQHPLPTVLAGLRRHRQLIEIAVPPLDQQATEQLAVNISGAEIDRDQATALYAETEGNPLFIVETMRSHSAISPRPTFELTSTIHSVIEARLANLSPQAHELAGVAATIGRTFTFDVLSKAATLSPDELVRAIDELWQRRIVREQGSDAYDFSHGKLGEVAYAKLSAARKHLLHRRVAEALLALNANDLDRVSGQIASHFERASLPMQALPYYVRAGDAAQRVYANEAAIEFYQHALQLAGQDSNLPYNIVLKLGEVWQHIGQWREAETAYQQAREAAQQKNDQAALARSQLALGRVSALKGSYQDALTYLEEAQHEFEALNDRHGIGETFGEMATAHWYLGDYPHALEFSQRQFEMAELLEDRSGLAAALKRIGSICADQGEYDRALIAHQQFAQIAEQNGDRRGVAIANGNIGAVYWQMGDHVQSLIHLTKNLKIAQEIGDKRSMTIVLGNIGLLYRHRGEYDLALACYARDLEIALEMSDVWNMSIVGYMAVVYVLKQRYAEADRTAAQAVAIGRALNIQYYLSEFLQIQADSLAQQQRYSEAQPINTEALRIASEVKHQQPHFQSALMSIRLQLALKQIDLATARTEVEAMLTNWPDDQEQARLHDELYMLNDQRRDDPQRSIAVDLYARLHTRTPNLEFRDRYFALTGDRLPDPPPLPADPPIDLQRPIDLAALLDRVDRAIAELP
jgi:DNA-binding SARP family transcriptional activator